MLSSSISLAHAGNPYAAMLASAEHSEVSLSSFEARFPPVSSTSEPEHSSGPSQSTPSV
jgi:hypothetical protein